MSVTASTLRKLSTLNLSPEQMAGVLSVMADVLENQEVESTKNEMRKQKDRERKRKFRGNSAEIPVETPSNGSNVSDGFPSDSLSLTSLTSLTPPKENPPKGGQKKNPLPLPDWIPAERWEEFKAMRLKIRKPMSIRAEQLAVGKLEKFRAMGHDPGVVLDQSIMNCWQDLFEPKENYASNWNNNTKPAKQTWKSAAEQLAEEYRQNAEREEQAAAYGTAGPSLRIAEAIRQDTG